MKKLYVEVAKIYKNKSIHEIVKKDKEICAAFAITPQNVKVMATMHNE